MIKYLGSKRNLVARILERVQTIVGARTVLDLFAGTSRVGMALKAAGYRVIANDHNAYAETLARCYVQADAEDVLADAARLVAEMNALPGRPGYVTETFCERARFFQPKNGARIDAVREAIAEKGLPPELEAVLLVALMEAADRVDSTTGVHMAYLKTWAPRSFRELELRVPEVLPRARHGKGVAAGLDALDAARSFDADVVYVDPPYNRHSYLGNYHVWESLVRWDKPATFGVACKRVDVKERGSAFNSKPRFAETLRATLAAVRAPTVVLSFNDEGFLSRAELEAMLAGLWGGAVEVATFAYELPRYVGAKIGIYDPQGKKVGKIGRLRNVEHLFVASRTAAVACG